MQGAHLFQQFAHVLRAGAGRRLIGHGGDPFDRAGPQQSAHRHQHQRYRAIAADEILDAFVARRLHHRQIDRIQDDDGVLAHAQAGRGIDPVALPACCAQARMNRFGVVAALGADEHGQLGERGDVIGVLHRGVFRAGGADVGSRRAGLRGAEKRRPHEIEVFLLAHSVEKHRPHHAAPTNDADLFHCSIINSAAGGRRL